MNEPVTQISAERLEQLRLGFSTWATSGRSAAPDLDKDTASALTELQSLRSQAGVSEAVAWQYELATCKLGGVTGIEGYASFEPRLTFDKPIVPDGAVRNLRPLFARPAPIEITEEPTASARFRRLYGICRRILWTDASTPAFGNDQTKAAFDDLAEFMFMDGIDAALQGETK